MGSDAGPSFPAVSVAAIVTVKSTGAILDCRPTSHISTTDPFRLNIGYCGVYSVSGGRPATTVTVNPRSSKLVQLSMALSILISANASPLHHPPPSPGSNSMPSPGSTTVRAATTWLGGTGSVSCSFGLIERDAGAVHSQANATFMLDTREVTAINGRPTVGEIEFALLIGRAVLRRRRSCR
jgi:hypothetical protein